MLRGEADVGEHVVLDLVHEGRQLRPARAALVGEVPPGLPGAAAVGLHESLTDRGGDHGVLAAGDVGERVAHEVDPAALPGGADDAGDGRLQPLVRVRDHQLHAPEAAADEILEEARPERLRLGGADVQADDLASPVGVGGDGDYGRDRDDAPALAHLQVGRVEPHTGPVPVQRALQESPDALVDLLAELRDLALRDAAQPHRLDEVVDPARRHPRDPRLLDHRDQRLLRRLPGFQEGREVAPGPQLRDAQVQLPEPGVERPVAVAVAPGRPLAAALMAPGADQPFHVRLHEDLEHRLGKAAKEIAVIGLL